MTIEQTVARHYTHGALEQALLAGLAAAGKDIGHLTTADLAPVDEFHVGGLQATIDFAAEMGIAPGMHLLDIGCGIGGPARYFAGALGCRVAGIDLTAEYVAVAASLSRRVGLADRVAFHQGSALALPFPPNRFDGAYMLHVGMNIADKAALFAQVRKALKPGAVFGVYDVMRESGGDVAYPVPWSSEPATSFLETAATYRRLLEAAGFAVLKERSRRQFGIDFFRARVAQAAASGPPPLGSQIVMGPTAPQKIANLLANMERGLVAPTEIVCKAGDRPHA